MDDGNPFSRWLGSQELANILYEVRSWDAANSIYGDARVIRGVRSLWIELGSVFVELVEGRGNFTSVEGVRIFGPDPHPDPEYPPSRIGDQLSRHLILVIKRADQSSAACASPPPPPASAPAP